MGCMPNSLSLTKSLKNALAVRKKRIIHRKCRFYIINYIFLFYLSVYVLRHLNYLVCPCLSFLRIFLSAGGGGGIIWIFLQKIRFPFSDLIYLAIYYNLIMQFMSCDTYVMLNTHVSCIMQMKCTDESVAYESVALSLVEFILLEIATI